MSWDVHQSNPVEKHGPGQDIKEDKYKFQQVFVAGLVLLNETHLQTK